MTVVAAIRPDSWNFPLFIHVFGAMVLTGGLLGSALALLSSRGSRFLPGLGFRLLLLIALIVGGIGVRRLREGKGSGLLRATLVVAIILLAAYVVAVWAMAGKPD